MYGSEPTVILNTRLCQIELCLGPNPPSVAITIDTKSFDGIEETLQIRASIEVNFGDIHTQTGNPSKFRSGQKVAYLSLSDNPVQAILEPEPLLGSGRLPRQRLIGVHDFTFPCTRLTGRLPVLAIVRLNANGVHSRLQPLGSSNSIHVITSSSSRVDVVHIINLSRSQFSVISNPHDPRK